MMNDLEAIAVLGVLFDPVQGKPAAVGCCAEIFSISG